MDRARKSGPSWSFLFYRLVEYIHEMYMYVCHDMQLPIRGKDLRRFADRLLLVPIYIIVQWPWPCQLNFKSMVGL